MRVPRRVLVQVDAGFDKPLGHQHRESKLILTVTLEGSRISVLDVECIIDLRSNLHGDCLLTVLIELAGHMFQTALLALDFVEQPNAATKLPLIAFRKSQRQRIKNIFGSMIERRTIETKTIKT